VRGESTKPGKEKVRLRLLVLPGVAVVLEKNHLRRGCGDLKGGGKGAKRVVFGRQGPNSNAGLRFKKAICAVILRQLRTGTLRHGCKKPMTAWTKHREGRYGTITPQRCTVPQGAGTYGKEKNEKGVKILM